MRYHLLIDVAARSSGLTSNTPSSRNLRVDNLTFLCRAFNYDYEKEQNSW